MADDASLIARVLVGDAEAFRDLVRRHQGPVFAVARSFATCAGEVEDVAQDAFLAAYASLRSFDPTRGSFRTWLLAIARNRCRDLGRRRRPAPLEVADGILAAPRVPTADGALFEQLDRALTALSPELRLAFLLVHVYGVPAAEVAALERTPLGTIKSRASRARAALRERLASCREPCDERT